MQIHKWINHNSQNWSETPQGWLGFFYIPSIYYKHIQEIHLV